MRQNISFMLNFHVPDDPLNMFILSDTETVFELSETAGLERTVVNIAAVE